MSWGNLFRNPPNDPSYLCVFAESEPVLRPGYNPFPPSTVSGMASLPFPPLLLPLLLLLSPPLSSSWNVMFFVSSPWTCRVSFLDNAQCNPRRKVLLLNSYRGSPLFQKIICEIDPWNVSLLSVDFFGGVFLVPCSGVFCCLNHSLPSPSPADYETGGPQNPKNTGYDL